LHNLAPTDWLIVLLSLFCILAIGFSVRSSIKTAKDFFQAGRVLPTWICAVAFVAATLGSQEVIAAGAAGARFGLKATTFFWLGAVPVMLLAGLSVLPLLYGSGARTVPEYLALRFDEKTRLLSAGMFAVITLANAGFSLYLMARMFETLRIFEPLFYSYGWPHEWIFTFCVLLFAAVVLVSVWVGGLAGVMVNQGLQFLLIVTAFLPMALIGLRNVGGLSGLSASIPGSFLHTALGLSFVPSMLFWCLFGLVLGAGHWLTDFRILQTAMAAKDVDSAGRIPLVAAGFRLVLPFLLVLPGAIAISLPTPQSTTVVRNENGTIYHEITVVAPEAAQGQGLVPAQLDPATHTARVGADGQVVLNYEMATPNIVMHYLPTGLLGLGVAALLASLMSGLAGGVTAFTAVFAFDLYPPICKLLKREPANDVGLVRVGRWTTLGAILVAIGVAYAAAGLPGMAIANALAALLLVFSIGNASQLATFLLGMYTKRATSQGAFAGMVAGAVAALVHHGLTIPADAHAGLAGGWITVVFRYPGFVAQSLATATIGFTANLLVAGTVSYFTKAKPEKELKKLVHWMRPKARKQVWWKRPKVMAAAILAGAVVVGVILA